MGSALSTGGLALLRPSTLEITGSTNVFTLTARPRTGGAFFAEASLWISTTEHWYAAVERYFAWNAVHSREISSVVSVCGQILIISTWFARPEVKRLSMPAGIEWLVSGTCDGAERDCCIAARGRNGVS